MSSQTPDFDDSSAETRLPKQVKIVLVVLVSTAFVMMLNETTLAVALPAIMNDFTIPADTAQWLLTGFMLTMAVVLPTTGWVLDRFTTRAVFIFAVAIFLVGTVVAAIAPSFAVLLASRVAQATGTAVIMPLLMTVSMTMVPFARRGAVMGLIGVVMAAGPALGPTVAGIILNITSWHGIFWTMVPLVATAGIVGAAKLTNVGNSRNTPLDVLSVILSVVAFSGLVYGLGSVSAISAGETAGMVALISLIVGFIGVAVFVWRQLSLGKSGRALLDLRPLANRNYTISLLVLLGLFGALLGAATTLPLYLQGSLLVTALVAGLALLPGGVLEAVLSPIAGRLYDMHGPRPLVIPGMIITVLTLFALTWVTASTPLIVVILLYAAFSMALALLFTPLMTTALSSLPQPLYSHGSAILNTLQQLAGAAGTAVMISVYSAVALRAQESGVREPEALAQGANSAFLVATIIAAIALVLSFFIVRLPQGGASEAQPTNAG